jgi:CBS domain-containing protein
MEQGSEVAATDLALSTTPLNAGVAGSRVADIMTTELITLSPHHTFGEAVQLMSNHRFRHFLVLHADGTLAGVFSDRDVLRALGRTPNWQAKTVSGVMTHTVVTVQPETPLSVAATEMLKRRINCLPVVGADGKICGVITSTDLLTNFQKLQETLEVGER